MRYSIKKQPNGKYAVIRKKKDAPKECTPEEMAMKALDKKIKETKGDHDDEGDHEYR